MHTLSYSRGVTMTVGSLLLQCLLAGVIFDSQLVLTAAQQDYRLTGGSTEYEGTVEVFRNGEWQTVCNDGWGLTEGNLVCRLLGYGPAIAAYTDAADRFGEGAGNIWVKDWECTGRENSLEECPSGPIIFCLDSEAAGVLCRQPTTTPTPSTTPPTSTTPAPASSTTAPTSTTSAPTSAQQDYRLTGGSTQYEGTVEVFRNGEWQTVCNDGWELTEGNLVCRLLGYGPAIAAYTDAAVRFGEGAGNIWVKDWECTGRENSLEECPSAPILFCLDSEAAGVLCRQSISTTPALASNATVPVLVWYIVGSVGGSMILLCLCCCICILCGVCCHILGKLDCNCCEDCLSSCTDACCSPCVACISSCGNCIKTCVLACCAPCLACLQAFGDCCSACTNKMCTAIGQALKTCCTACCLPFVLCGKCLKAMVSYIGSCTQMFCTNLGKCLKACCTTCCAPFVLCGKAIKACFTAIGAAIQSCFAVLCLPLTACTECLEGLTK